MYRIFLNFAKSSILSFFPNFDKKKLHRAVLKYKCLKLKLRVFLAGDTVAMVTCSVMKMTTSGKNDIKIYVLESAGNCLEPP